MSPLEIKIELMKRNVSMADIGRAVGQSRQNIFHVVSGRVKTRDIREVIAAVLGKTPFEVFGDEDAQKQTNKTNNWGPSGALRRQSNEQGWTLEDPQAVLSPTS